MTGTGKDACICSSSARPSAACAAASTARFRASPATMRAAFSPKARRQDRLRRQRRASTSCAASSRPTSSRHRPARGQDDRLRQCRRDRQEGHRPLQRGQLDVCTLFYSQFKSVISQVPTAQQIIRPRMAKAANRRAAAPLRIRAEPARSLRPHPAHIAVQIFRALLENAAGEMGAKMTAMDNATRNAGDMINKLSIHLQRQRQRRSPRTDRDHFGRERSRHGRQGRRAFRRTHVKHSYEKGKEMAKAATRKPAAAAKAAPAKKARPRRQQRPGRRLRNPHRVKAAGRRQGAPGHRAVVACSSRTTSRPS